MTDLRPAELFLQLLDSAGMFTFQTFSDTAAARDRGVRPLVMHGTLDEHSGALIRENEVGAGNFVMVNAGDGVVHEGAKTCRTAGGIGLLFRASTQPRTALLRRSVVSGCYG